MERQRRAGRPAGRLGSALLSSGTSSFLLTPNFVGFSFVFCWPPAPPSPFPAPITIQTGRNVPVL